jgi:hypothetical protein
MINSRPVGYACWTNGSEPQAHVGVSPTEGNEGRRDGPQGVGAPHTTGEAGERLPRGPRGGKGVPRHGPLGGHRPRASNLGCLST